MQKDYSETNPSRRYRKRIPKWQRMLRKYWPPVRFALICLIILVVAIVTVKGIFNIFESEPTTDDSNPNYGQANVSTVPTLDASIPQTLATDYMKNVIYISDEWTAGNYLVYGTDQSGKSCYGVLYQGGQFAPLQEYEAYYPLANGHLFVTNDGSFAKNFHSTTKDSNKKSLCASGKIIDYSGKVLYEPSADEPYQKMYVINSNSIFVLAASSGFNGVEIYWGVLDSNGQWVHELDNTGMLVETIKQFNLIEVNNDGNWSYANTSAKITGYTSEGKLAYDHRILNVSKGGSFDNNENKSLVFYLETEYSDEKKNANREVIVFLSDTNEFEKIQLKYQNNDNSLIQVSEKEWIQWRSSSQMRGYTSQTYQLYRNGSAVDEIPNYLLTVDGIKYWYEGVSVSLASGEIQHGAIMHSDIHPDGIAYPESISMKTKTFISADSNQIVMLVEGDDSLPYIAVGDSEGNILREPFRPTSFSGAYLTTYNEYIAYRNGDEGTIYLYDMSSENTNALPITTIDTRIDNLRFLGNSLIAVEVDDDELTEIYNFNGERIA